MILSILVVPFRSIDLSLRHVSATWPGHYGCDPDARGQHGGGWELHLSQGVAELRGERDTKDRGAAHDAHAPDGPKEGGVASYQIDSPF